MYNRVYIWIFSEKAEKILEKKLDKRKAADPFEGLLCGLFDSSTSVALVLLTAPLVIAFLKHIFQIWKKD